MNRQVKMTTVKAEDDSDLGISDEALDQPRELSRKFAVCACSNNCKASEKPKR